MDVRRRVVFSYTLFVNSQETTGEAGSSGFAEVNGNDAMITRGGFGFSLLATSGLTAEQNPQRYINMQASTLLHEFGHNLGLRHGGHEETNYKPIYVSVMNFMYQLVGVPGVQNTSAAGDRYLRYVSGLNGAPTSGCALINSRCTSTFIIDYSNGSSADFNEASLFGVNLIGRGNAAAATDFVNWSGTATVASPAYVFDINRDMVTNVPLKDYNDWANIKLPFARSFSRFNAGVALDNSRARSTVSDVPRRDPMNDAASKEFIREDQPTAQFLRMLQD